MLILASILLSGNAKVTVDVHILLDCPIARTYMPEISRTAKQYRPKGVGMAIVVEDQDATRASLVKFGREYSLDIPLLIDKARVRAQVANVRAVPTAVVRVGPKITYVGRIDNLYASLGVKRRSASKHDLRLALDRALKGKTEFATTPVIGCAIGD